MGCLVVGYLLKIGSSARAILKRIWTAVIMWRILAQTFLNPKLPNQLVLTVLSVNAYCISEFDLLLSILYIFAQ